METTLMCPTCHNTLLQKDNTFQCENNHSFDLAKEDYLNLLLVNQRSSVSPGDDDSMVIARRNFLNKEYYLPLSNELNTIIKNNAKVEKDPLKILDCGCGEGYYLRKLFKYFQTTGTNTAIYGIDISKTTIKLAANTLKNAFFIVSNINYSLPFKNESFNILLNIFAPKNPAEFHRVLTKKGILIVIFPTRNHLSSLKKILDISIDYDSKQDTVMNSFTQKFKLIDTKQIETTIKLKSEDAIELVKMTPIYWQIDQRKLAKLGEIQTEIGFNIYVFKK